MNITKLELQELCLSVFPKLQQNESLAILIDLPDEKVPDNEMWYLRRKIAVDWFHKFSELLKETSLYQTIDLLAYKNVQSNNADLPNTMYVVTKDVPATFADILKEEDAKPITTETVLKNYQLFFAPTEFSTTAPLKIAAKKYFFRAATMSGFCAAMIPALKLDYNLIYKRLCLLKQNLDLACGALVEFFAQGTTYNVYFDLQNRNAHVSAGRFPEKGAVGNLPSGETYIVPYEGEKESSKTRGTLPVQFENEIVLYQIENNRAIGILSEGEFSQKEKDKLQKEPAYGNIAELGFGILSDFGIVPIGEVLLDEKLGFHVAFGRSDHFGGFVGTKDFSCPENVVHIDYVYIPQTQPQINIAKIELHFEDGAKKIIMNNNKYTLWEK